MPVRSADVLLPARSPAWKWWVCGLLLLATMLNYMDRLTINQMSKEIIEEFRLTKEQYGQIEQAFGVAFALGAVLIGWTTDRLDLRWVYPLAVLAWSVAGFVTGFAGTFGGLLLCRSALGLTEAGHWPCGLRTTQRVLSPGERTLGNGILQSGAALGAIVTPLIILALVDGEGTWRLPFFVIGSLGVSWALLWWVTVKPGDLTLPPSDPRSDPPAGASPEGQSQPPLWTIFWDRRFWVLVVLAVAINLTWHYFRVWLPLFLREEHGYGNTAVQWFTSAYYLATDAGSLLVGFATLYLARHGMSVHRSRVLMYLACSLLTALSVLVAFLPPGPLLLGLLLVIGFGGLGLFPTYYALSQELTVRHQGKVTGTLGCLNWLVTSQMHPLVGRLIDQTSSYSLGVALAGLPPLIGLAALALFWKEVPGLKTEI
jgi:ACS family hexuronate transporter-like MFS transporter